MRVAFWIFTAWNYPTGEVGEVIRAKVRDDAPVTQVNILIASGDDVVPEQGEMAHEQGVCFRCRKTNVGSGELGVFNFLGIDFSGIIAYNISEVLKVRMYRR